MNNENNIDRPKGFTFLSALFAYMSFAGLFDGFQLASKYGSIPGILGFFYSLSSMVIAYALWFYCPWAFYAEIIWALSVLAWVFNYQYGLRGEYTLPLHYFILYIVFLSTMFVLLAFYIKRRLRVLNESLSIGKENEKIKTEELTSGLTADRD